MTKPLTVEQALKNLTESVTAKPTPAAVTIVEPTLKGEEAVRFFLALFLNWQVRTAIVWGFLAIFFPQLGATYLMVMLGLWALTHAKPTDVRSMVRAVANKRK